MNLQISNRAIATIPVEFACSLTVLSGDLSLALQYIDLVGGIPLPVAKAILRNIEPVKTAIDLAINNATAAAENQVR